MSKDGGEMEKPGVSFNELKQVYKIALKISPVNKGHSFSTARTYYAETILSMIVLTAHEAEVKALVDLDSEGEK